MIQRIIPGRFKSFLIMVILIAFGNNIYGKTISTQKAIHFVSTDFATIMIGDTINGYLDVLWMDTLEITNITKRIVFRFYATNKKILTLRGWINDDNNFPDDPNVIKLNNGPASSVQFGVATYFGNIILKGDDSKALIRKARNRNKKYVILVPIAPGDADFPDQIPGQIAYKILLDDAPPAADFFTKDTKTLIKTGLSINPSPPRNPS